MTFIERIATLPEFLMRLWWVWLLFGIWGFLSWIADEADRTRESYEYETEV
jgi:hypothetical protein